MKYVKIFILLVTAFFLSNSMSLANYQVSQPVFSGGGGPLTGSSYQMRPVVIGQNMTPMKLSNDTYITQANSGYVLMRSQDNAPVFNGGDDYYVADNLTVNPAEFNGASIGEVLNQMTGDYSDIDHDTQFGIAVTGVSNTNGQWQFSTNSGQTWDDIVVVSDDNALLLADDTQTRLRFQPDMDYMGGYPGDITFRIWDQYRGNTGDINVNLNDASWIYTVSRNSGLLIGNVMSVPVAVPSMNFWGIIFLTGILIYFSLKIMHQKQRSVYCVNKSLSRRSYFRV
jgi:hypothetical protein